jgi:hypothetical protein
MILALLVGGSTVPAPRAFYGRRLEPRESVVLHGAGQSDETSFAAYTNAMSPARPMLSMSYVDLRDDLPAYFARLRAELARHPDLIVPQIGLSLNAGEARKHYEGEVARGVDDARLRTLCDGFRSLHRPVFLRIGYEFNGSWNGYGAAQYVAAFRHIAAAIRGCGLENVALVWDWSVDAELDAEHGGAARSDAAMRYAAFYPGDDAVDWWGVNLFSAESLSAPATKNFLDDAAKRRFPVMIGESAPRGHPVSEGQAAVDAWFVPYFALIRSSPVIKAFCYIDWDWRVYPQWADWGDSRVQDDPAVLRFWRGEIVSPLYADARGRAETLRLLRAK